MKKIFSLVALLATMATAAWASYTKGPFTFSSASSAIYYEAERPNEVRLKNADIESLEINPSSTYGKNYYIYIEGDCKIEPKSKLDPITFKKKTADNSNTSYQLFIYGVENSNATLVLTSQLNAGIYFEGYNSSDKLTLYMGNVDMTCNGKLQSAKYGISSYYNNKLTLYPSVGLTLTLDGKTAPWYGVGFISGQEMMVLEPAGAEINKANDNNFIKYNGETYNGKVKLVTASGITVAGTDITPLNQDNVTSEKITGKVSYADGVLTLENAVINGDLKTVQRASLTKIQLIGDNVINGDLSLYGSSSGDYETVITSDGTGSLTVNGAISVTTAMTLVINNAKVDNYTKYSTLTLNHYAGTGMNLKLLNNGSYYGEADSFDAKLYYGSTYVKTEGTNGNLKTLYIREVKDYGIDIYYSDNESTKITNENSNDVLGDGGSVVYDPENYRLTLTNAKIFAIATKGSSGFEINLVGENIIAQTNGATTMNILTNSLVISGSGSANIISRSYGSGLNGADVISIKNTTVNFSVGGYAIEGNTAVYIQNSNVSLMSTGAQGLINVTNFELTKAEFVAPTDVMFYKPNLCVNYQPLAANTKVEIKALAEGLEEVMAATPADKARKVMIDGQVYILRDGKAYNVLGTEVK